LQQQPLGMHWHEPVQPYTKLARYEILVVGPPTYIAGALVAGDLDGILLAGDVDLLEAALEQGLGGN
jgi:hypothetical protein